MDLQDKRTTNSISAPSRGLMLLRCLFHVSQSSTFRTSPNHNSRMCNIEIKFAYEDDIGDTHNAVDFLLYFSTG